MEYERGGGGGARGATGPPNNQANHNSCVCILPIFIIIIIISDFLCNSLVILLNMTSTKEYFMVTKFSLYRWPPQHAIASYSTEMHSAYHLYSYIIAHLPFYTTHMYLISSMLNSTTIKFDVRAIILGVIRTIACTSEHRYTTVSWVSAHGRLNITGPHGHLPGIKTLYVCIEAATLTP